MLEARLGLGLVAEFDSLPRRRFASDTEIEERLDNDTGVVSVWEEISSETIDVAEPSRSGLETPGSGHPFRSDVLILRSGNVTAM